MGFGKWWKQSPVTTVSNIGSSVDDAVISPVVETVKDTGSSIDDAVLQPVGKAVEGTLKSIEDDPLKAAAIALAVGTGNAYLVPYIQGGAALANGASPEEALQQAAVAYAAGQVGAGVGAETGSNIAGGSAAGATGAALKGGDIGQGLISGGVNAGIGSAAKSISDANFEDWAKEQAGNTYDNAPSPTEQDVLDYIDRESADSPLSTLDRNNPAYAADNIDVGGGFNPATGTGDAATADAAAAMPPLTPDLPPEAYDPALTTGQIKTGLNYVKNALLAPDRPDPQQRARAVQYATQGIDPGIPWLDTKEQMLRNTGRIKDVNDPQSQEELFASLAPELRDEFSSRGIGSNMMRAQAPRISGLGFSQFAAGGTASSKTTDLTGMGEYAPKFYPISGTGMLSGGGGKRQQAGMTPLKHLYNSISPSGNMGGMAKGGLPSKYHDAAPDGHNPEFVTGLTGYYACGGGTGQSDDIPAMLHDGDYVMDAEAVSALGDGSSKAGREVLEGFRKQVPHKDGAQGKPVPAKIADGEYVFPASFVTALGGGDNKKGADILNGLREKLRTHKRSAPTSKIPPKAKSPLDYIKGSKG
jgi:hypothetical protein